MALGYERRAGGRAMEQYRRTNNEASRRAGDKQMEATRRGEAVAEDINSLVRPQRQARTLPKVPPVGALPAQRSSADYKAPAAGGTGGGIASPLVEKSKTVEGKAVPDRDYYDQVLLPTTDGLVWVRWRSVKTVRMTDANGENVVMEYGNDLSE